MAPKRPAKTAALPIWAAADPSKRWCEVFFLAYSPFWILWALCLLVPLRLYDRLGPWGYMAVGVAAAAPTVAIPALFPGAADAARPLRDRFWVKATIWIAIFSHIGNYFWTHYFYQLLGAEYTFAAHRLNGVPFALYLLTHAYFCFYHALSNVTLRVAGRLAGRRWGARAGLAARVAATAALSYATAYGETATIAHFPHYRFQDRARMYTVGSLFYAIYFFVSFPWFFAMDEGEGWDSERPPPPPARARWPPGRAAADALASGMLVTMLLDAWRLGVGGIVPARGGGWRGARVAAALPWM